MEQNHDHGHKNLDASANFPADPLTGKPTVITAHCQGYTAPSGHEGTPANGTDLAPAARRRNAQTYRGSEQACQEIQSDLGIAYGATAADALVSYLAGKARPNDPAEAARIDALHQCMGGIPHSA